jgi:hypothetical protein
MGKIDGMNTQAAMNYFSPEECALYSSWMSRGEMMDWQEPLTFEECLERLCSWETLPWEDLGAVRRIHATNASGYPASGRAMRRLKLGTKQTRYYQVISHKENSRLFSEAHFLKNYAIVPELVQLAWALED